MTRRTATKSRNKNLGRCGRCLGQSVPATTVETLTFGAGSYQIPLCEDHADGLLDALFAWSRCGTLVDDESGSWAKSGSIEPKYGTVLHSIVPSFGTFKEPAPEPEPLPTQRTPVARRDPMAGVRSRWKWSKHAEERFDYRTRLAAQYGLVPMTRDEVLWTAERPDVVRPNRNPKYPGSNMHVRGYLHVVVNGDGTVILTVIDTRLDEEMELQNAS